MVEGMSGIRNDHLLDALCRGLVSSWQSTSTLFPTSRSRFCVVKEACYEKLNFSTTATSLCRAAARVHFSHLLYCWCHHHPTQVIIRRHGSDGRWGADADCHLSAHSPSLVARRRIADRKSVV